MANSPNAQEETNFLSRENNDITIARHDEDTALANLGDFFPRRRQRKNINKRQNITRR